MDSLRLIQTFNRRDGSNNPPIETRRYRFTLHVVGERSASIIPSRIRPPSQNFQLSLVFIGQMIDSYAETFVLAIDRMDVAYILSEYFFTYQMFGCVVVLFAVFVNEFGKFEIEVGCSCGMDEFRHRIESVYVAIAGTGERTTCCI